MSELDASVMKDGLVRADTLPLVFRAAGAESLPRGAHVRVRVGEADLLTLDLHASVVARLDTVLSTTGDAPTAESDTEDSDEADGAGPLTLAIDLKDDEADTGPEPAAAA